MSFGVDPNWLIWAFDNNDKSQTKSPFPMSFKVKWNRIYIWMVDDMFGMGPESGAYDNNNNNSKVIYVESCSLFIVHRVKFVIFLKCWFETADIPISSNTYAKCPKLCLIRACLIPYYDEITILSIIVFHWARRTRHKIPI